MTRPHSPLLSVSLLSPSAVRAFDRMAAGEAPVCRTTHVGARAALPESSYRLVWQTWSFVRRTAHGSQTASVHDTPGRAHSYRSGTALPREEVAKRGAELPARSSTLLNFPVQPEETRHRLQRLRIERRLSIARVAHIGGCTPETMASYERGEDILDTAIVERILRVLESQTG